MNGDYRELSMVDLDAVIAYARTPNPKPEARRSCSTRDPPRRHHEAHRGPPLRRGLGPAAREEAGHRPPGGHEGGLPGRGRRRACTGRRARGQAAAAPVHDTEGQGEEAPVQVHEPGHHHEALDAPVLIKNNPPSTAQ